MTNPEITIGTRVRSFDFPDNRQLTGERACYVEGEVTGAMPVGLSPSQRHAHLPRRHRLRGKDLKKIACGV